MSSTDYPSFPSPTQAFVAVLDDAGVLVYVVNSFEFKIDEAGPGLFYI